MENKKFKASLGQVSDRESFTISFIHPRLIDKDGNCGKRIHRGLGTQDKVRAESLVGQMNEILTNEELWHLGARERALSRYDKKVIELFYDEIQSAKSDSIQKRDEIIPYPNNAGYRKVLLLGTTGAGKTTLVRQLLGTDPKKDRFPSTSTAKTTVADMEFILSEGNFSAVVTFLQFEEVMEYIKECVISAVEACCKNENDNEEIMRCLLNHQEQRFRMSYILGDYKNKKNSLDEEEEEDGDEEGEEFLLNCQVGEVEENFAVDFEFLLSQIKEISKIFNRYKTDLENALRGDAKSKEDKTVSEELVEEESVRLIQNEKKFQLLVDFIKEEIKKRFNGIKEGGFKKDGQGWPELWQYSTNYPDKNEFIKTLSSFTSNYSGRFGSLLTPIVNGIRVKGPFIPTGFTHIPQLILLDGEGVGHTFKTATSLSISTIQRIENSDCILLVDNATQPMQAGALLILSQVASSGYQSKLFICFTHFDAVRGDNIPKRDDKKKHVFSSLEDALRGIGAKLGISLEKSLKDKLTTRCLYFSHLPDKLSDDIKEHKRTISEIKKLIQLIQEPEKPLSLGESSPVYDRTQLIFRIRGAAERFHNLWDAILGNRYDGEIPKEHWTRIKALSRRLAVLNEKEYDNLKPVGDLYKELIEAIRCFIESPIRWEPVEPDEKIVQETCDVFAREISQNILNLVSLRLHSEKESKWLEAFNCSGRGSTYERASIISRDIYFEVAPILNEIPSLSGTAFRIGIERIVKEAAEKINAKLE